MARPKIKEDLSSIRIPVSLKAVIVTKAEKMGISAPDYLKIALAGEMK